MTDQSTKIPPLQAVREALGLSDQDIRTILGSDEEAQGVLDIEDAPSQELAVISEAASTVQASVFLEIKNPDGSLFKRWLVTKDGYLVDEDDG